MNISSFFIDRPIFASVIALFITLLGAFAYPALPLAQYPEIAPPSVAVIAAFPGASAETMAETIAAPIEQEINGVEGMLYMRSNSSQGLTAITVTFQPGTDIDTAQVLVQNRVALAEPRLPDQVRQIGVTVNKQATDFLMVAAMTIDRPCGRHRLCRQLRQFDQSATGCCACRASARCRCSAAAITRCASGSIRMRPPRAT